MNSLETIKQELINQKNLLENKGFSVTVHNLNPSPTEITDAINNININFTTTTATESDVKLGKTFFSQNNEIKTGKFDTSYYDSVGNKVCSLISGEAPMEIDLPLTITRLRERAYWSDPATGDISGLFYKHDLTIPSNITTLCDQCFYGCSLTGKLTIPSTCTKIYSQSFNRCTMSEVELNAGFIDGETYVFANCTNLTKVNLVNFVGTIPLYTFSKCSALEEVIMPSTPTTSLGPTVFKDCSKLKFLKFVGNQPYILGSTSMTSHKTVAYVVPYEYYEIYDNATNYHAFSNPIYGYGEFEQGSTLPSGIEGYTFVWYSTFADIKAGTNPVTTCETSGTYYAAATEIVDISDETVE